jgi:hypothetical protein
MNPAEQQSTGAGTTGQTGTTSTAGSGGDMLDKGVNYAEKQTGHEQKSGTTEKVGIIGNCWVNCRLVMDFEVGLRR